MSLPSRILLAAATLAAASSAHAATVTWDGTTGNGVIDTANGTWNTTGTNWSSDAGETNTAFTNGDTAVLTGDLTSAAAQTLTLGSNITAAGLRADATNGNNTTITASGFSLSFGGLSDVAGTGAYGQNLTINGNGTAAAALLSLSGASTWNIANTKILTVTAGAAGQTVNLGSGTVTVTGGTAANVGLTNTANNSATGINAKIQGGATIQSGTFNVDSGILSFAGSAGRTTTVDSSVTVNVASGASLYVSRNSAGGSAFNMATTLADGAILRQESGTSTGQSTTINGMIDLTSGTANIVNAASVADFTLAGVISGNGGLNLSRVGTATGITTLSAINTYTGNTTVTSGAVALATTGAINVGAAGVTIASGATLTLTGNARLELTSGASTIANSGTISGSGILDLNGLFDGYGDSSYELISVGENISELTLAVTGFDTTIFQSVTFNNTNGKLDFVTAVPEPSTYGLIGAGALAAAALVHRRRKGVATE